MISSNILLWCFSSIHDLNSSDKIAALGDWLAVIMIPRNFIILGNDSRGSLLLSADNPAGRHYESGDGRHDGREDGVAEIISAAKVQQDVHRLMTVITCRPRIMSLFYKALAARHVCWETIHETRDDWRGKNVNEEVWRWLVSSVTHTIVTLF